jgi:predicted permease
MVLKSLGLIEKNIKFLGSYGSVLLAMVYCMISMMILPCHSAVDKMDFTLVEAARDLGSKPWRAFLDVTLPLTMAVTREKSRRGVLLQSVFRSNYALIGIPLSQSLYGDAGVTVATLLSAIVVPAFNILAVISLTLFRPTGGKPSVKKILLGIAKNPLIQGVFLGLAALGVRALLVQCDVSFRLDQIEPLFKVFNYLSGMATPMALLVLGAQFEFSAVSSLRREILFGTLVRTMAVPLFGLGCAYALMKAGVLDVTGAHFASFVAVFATPVAVSSVPMAQEMDSDATLAGQLVVWTTLVSALTVFLAAFILRYVGVFA